MGCSHTNVERRLHRNKVYPFGRKSKPREGRVKKITEVCKECGAKLRRYKVRG